MFDSSDILILLVLLVGSYVQAVAGFALGMIAVAVIGGLRLLDIPTLAAMVSLLSMLNASLSLGGHTQHVHRPMLMWLAIGIVPGLLLGYWFMLYLNGNRLWVLELCLGIFEYSASQLDPRVSRSFYVVYGGDWWHFGWPVFCQRASVGLVCIQPTFAGSGHSSHPAQLFLSGDGYTNNYCFFRRQPVGFGITICGLGGTGGDRRRLAWSEVSASRV